MGLPRPTTVVKYLLIINIAVFLLQIIFSQRLEIWFAAMGTQPLQVWRLITFQFLHAASNPFHLLFNMIGLYFLGPILERTWGGRKFLTFYLLCGAVGGFLFVAASNLDLLDRKMILVGASGGVLGLLVACAVLFPQITVILVLFPVPIRAAAILLTAVYFLIVITSGPNAGGHLCHLGGMATGLVWVMGRGHFAALWQKRRRGAYRRKMEQEEQIQYEVDRILAKVHEQGIQSLTRREKEILRRATERHKRD